MSEIIVQKPEEDQENPSHLLSSLTNETAATGIESSVQEAVELNNGAANIVAEVPKSHKDLAVSAEFNRPLQALNVNEDKLSFLFSLATWIVIGLFIAIQLVIIERATNGPFFDEGIYITSGLRTLAGFGISDQYTTWFAGSLLWPVLAAFGFKACGLVGVRLVALLCTGLAIITTVKATRNLFGNKVAFWTALSFTVSGPTLALAHLGTYDVLALAGIGISFWAITELNKRDDRRWLMLATLAFTLAVLAKYPTGLCILTLVPLFFVLRGKRARLDVGIFGFISFAILMIYYLLLEKQIGQFLPWRLENNPSFGATPISIWTGLLYVSFVPLFLAGAGWIAAGKKRPLALVLLTALLAWPVYHLIAGNVVSMNKHVVFGFLFAYPLIGLTLATLARRWYGTLLTTLCLLVLAIFGYEQMSNLDNSWPDVRSTAQYLEGKVQPGAKLLINNSWPYTMYLYSQHQIEEPWQVYDVYRVQHDQAPVDLCEFDWLVNEEGVYSWPENILAEIKACGTFEEVYTTTSYVTNMAQNFQFSTNPVLTTVWHNVRNEVKR